MESKVNLLIFYRINLVKYLSALLDYVYLGNFSVIYGCHLEATGILGTCAQDLPTPLHHFFSLLCKSAPFSGYSQSFVLKC